MSILIPTPQKDYETSTLCTRVHARKYVQESNTPAPPSHTLRPRAPLPIPVPLVDSDPPLVPVPATGGAILDPPLCDPEDAALFVPLKPLPVPLVDGGFLSAASLLAAAAAASLSLSSARSCSCSLRLSASRAWWVDSASISWRSCVAPCQWPERSRRWVCSV